MMDKVKTSREYQIAKQPIARTRCGYSETLAFPTAILKLNKQQLKTVS
jgi:hypothetical protein